MAIEEIVKDPREAVEKITQTEAVIRLEASGIQIGVILSVEQFDKLQFHSRTAYNSTNKLFNTLSNTKD